MEKLTFKTRIGKTFLGFYIGMFIMILFFTIVTYMNVNDPSMFSFMTGICLVALLFMISSFLLLKISIEDHVLKVNMPYTIYKVDIKTITKIQKGQPMWTGFHKHGTATKGLIISSKFKNDLYITPKDEELFLQQLMQINPDIIIKKD